MLTFVWKKLGSPTLQPSTTAFHAYHVRFTKDQGILLNFPISLAGKKVLIDIEVVNAQLD